MNQTQTLTDVEAFKIAVDCCQEVEELVIWDKGRDVTDGEWINVCPVWKVPWFCNWVRTAVVFPSSTNFQGIDSINFPFKPILK